MLANVHGLRADHIISATRFEFGCQLRNEPESPIIVGWPNMAKVPGDEFKECHDPSRKTAAFRVTNIRALEELDTAEHEDLLGDLICNWQPNFKVVEAVRLGSAPGYFQPSNSERIVFVISDLQDDELPIVSHVNRLGRLTGPGIPHVELCER